MCSLYFSNLGLIVLYKICKSLVAHKSLYLKLKLILKRVFKWKEQRTQDNFYELVWKILNMLGYSVSFIKTITWHLIKVYFLVSVQNGSIHQKDAVNDDDFEPYLSSQTNQVSLDDPIFRKLNLN